MSLIPASRAQALCTATVLAVAFALGGCVNRPHRAPVEDRTATPRATVAAATPAEVPASGVVDPSKAPAVPAVTPPGYYTVKPGDTLIRIGLDSGQNWRDIVRWNNLENPNVVEVGQTLRIVPPGVDPAAATSRPVVPARVETRPLDARAAASAPTTSPPQVALASPGAATLPATTPAAPTPAPVPPPTPATTPPVPTATREGDDITWSWPVATSVSIPFDEARSKGMVFRGKAGDPVLAAADGRVVYAGSGLRGYGNLVILKHSPTYLTAYAHNQALAVKDDQTVRRGQKIAEMGSTDADSVQLHFEIRRQGKPIDPARLLPPR